MLALAERNEVGGGADETTCVVQANEAPWVKHSSISVELFIKVRSRCGCREKNAGRNSHTIREGDVFQSLAPNSR